MKFVACADDIFFPILPIQIQIDYQDINHTFFFLQVFVDALTEGEEATQEEKPISAQVDK